VVSRITSKDSEAPLALFINLVTGFYLLYDAPSFFLE
jgi:hypothetical protein